MHAVLLAPEAIDARSSARACPDCRVLSRNASAPTRSKVRALTQALSAHLLAASSATHALYTWCEARGLGEGNIVARLHLQDQAPTLNEDTRERLRVGAEEPVHTGALTRCEGGQVVLACA